MNEKVRLMFDYPEPDKCPDCYYWRVQIAQIKAGVEIVARCFSEDETCGSCCFLPKDKVKVV